MQRGSHACMHAEMQGKEIGCVIVRVGMWVTVLLMEAEKGVGKGLARGW